MVFSLGVNAPVERLFSLSNQTWTDEKSRLSIQKLKAILMIKYNIRMNCIEFYQSIKNMPNILRKIKDGQKYKPTAKEVLPLTLHENDTHNESDI